MSLITLMATMITPAKASAYLTSREIPVPEDSGKALGLIVRSSGAKTQGEIAALMINLTEGAISGEQLTEVLKVACPGDNIGERHGPYYLSLARTGKIKGSIPVEFLPAKKGKVAAVVAAPDNKELEATKARHLEETLALRQEIADLNAKLEVQTAWISKLEAGIKAAAKLKDCKALLEVIEEAPAAEATQTE